MPASAQPAAPPTPTANHTGVVRRWKAIAATAVAALAGYVVGRWGLDLLVGLCGLGLLAAITARAVLEEKRRRDRQAIDLDAIDHHTHLRHLLGDHR